MPTPQAKKLIKTLKGSGVERTFIIPSGEWSEIQKNGEWWWSFVGHRDGETTDKPMMVSQADASDYSFESYP